MNNPEPLPLTETEREIIRRWRELLHIGRRYPVTLFILRNPNGTCSIFHGQPAGTLADKKNK